MDCCHSGMAQPLKYQNTMLLPGRCYLQVMGRIVGILLLLLAAAAGAGYWFGTRKPAELNQSSILSQVQQLNDLATVKFTIQKVVGLREIKQPLGEESILLILQAHVEAGIHLNHLSASNITYRSDGTVVIRLPAPEILSVHVDESQTKVWDRQKTWWTPWEPYSLDLEQRARQAGIAAVRESAMSMGILNQAQENASSSIRSLLNLAGVRKVIVVPHSAS